MNQDESIDINKNKNISPQSTIPVKPAPEKKENFLREIVKFALIALIIIVPVRTFIAEPFIVSGLSMYPTFNNNQYLIVDQLTYDFSKPKRGDVIIFRYPNNPSVYFIKRIIGLPGERVSIVDGVVTIHNDAHPGGFALPESYVATDHRSYDNYDTTLSGDQYFVMGDNRNQSSDSRSWGPLNKNLIIGRPYVRLLPPSSMSILPGRVDLGNN